jgi:hypothetical protein
VNTALIVMAILGCGDDSSACQRVRDVPAAFATVEACNAASPAVLERLTDLSYPVIMAQCQKQPAPALAQKADKPQS